MSAVAFFRLKKLKGSGIMLAAARHNRRTIQAELGADSHINSALSHLNETLCGPPSPDEVAQLAKSAMQAAGVSKLRKDAVVGIEVVFSLPMRHGIDQRQYFTTCIEWAGVQFGGASNIMSADLHLDEAQPHMHILLVPLINGRMVGSEMVGNRNKLQALQSKYFEEVARPFGLSKPPAHMKGAAKAEAVARVLSAMKATNDPALKSAAWAVIRATIERSPEPFMTVLDVAITSKPKRLRSSTSIFTSTGKGPKTECKPSKPIGFKTAPEKQTLSCVGVVSQVASANAVSMAEQQPQPALPIVRVRDENHDAKNWDIDTGEFRPHPTTERTQKRAALAWVSTALHLVDVSKC